MNGKFRNGACIPTPFGYCVHYFSDLNFYLCSADRDRVQFYNPVNVAHWLVAEGWDEIFEPDYQPLEIQL
jgi:hypothetical protein